MQRIWRMMAVGVIAAAGWTSAQAAEPGMMTEVDFERRGVEPLGDTGLEATLNKARLVDSPVRSGKRALQVTLERTVIDGKPDYRTDFWIKGMSKSFKPGETYWYGFSVQFPADWEPDTQAELFAQWIGGNGGSPPLAIYVRGDEYQVTSRPKAGDPANVLWAGPVTPDRGKWVDWVFEIRWSSAADGQIRVWKNGKQLVDATCPNMAPVDPAPYFKFGIYKWPWKGSTKEAPSKVTRRVLYFDEIRIGNAQAGRAAVSPR
ncbi:MAG: polysaccharide lyase [Victivallaceae bacterium]